MHFVYIIVSVGHPDRYYIGLTANVRQRLGQLRGRIESACSGGGADRGVGIGIDLYRQQPQAQAKSRLAGGQRRVRRSGYDD